MNPAISPEHLTAEEIAAMWLYGANYAKSGLSAVDYWKKLPGSRKDDVRRFLGEIAQALDRPKDRQ